MDGGFEIHRVCLLAGLNYVIDDLEPITYLPAPPLAVGLSLSRSLFLPPSRALLRILALPLLQQVQVLGPGI